MYDYPSKEELLEFFEKFGPRGVLHTWANDPRWGKIGKQKIEDTGPLTKKGTLFQGR
jgi:hypothetical protein